MKYLIRALVDYCAGMNYIEPDSRMMAKVINGIMNYGATAITASALIKIGMSHAELQSGLEMILVAETLRNVANWIMEPVRDTKTSTN